MRYREQIRVPGSWWALGALFGLVLLLAFGLYLGPVVGVCVALVGMLITAAFFASAALVIEVGPDEVRIGRAVIGRQYVGAIRPLDADATRRRSELEADARAHLVLRPWVPTAVELTLTDPADPVPYWLVSTRRPAALAQALQRAPLETDGPSLA